ncbi:HK97 family phage prohead protease [Pseudorhodoferax sp. Leaf274]|uniref:HK97 family phage prohead protease n=1 Tax=Pseudorhodoferax sp. Leaf274 TaxID=1736318 RepID=UPI000702B1D2|nr:HK97 family phage prohead protease [Pseudorhodoferax sp. Leaf274]KQP35865.1 hypothetical protein ASF44_21450 [Pseudorhodoferax sp. Leaf274]
MTYLKYSQPSNRAYSTINIKATDRGDGTIVGIASTPELDRAGDVLLPEGAVYRLPIPLLWQHDHSKPIGHVTSARVGVRGIEIVAKIAVGATPEIDNAYSLIRAGLVRGLSVGFRPLELPEVTRTGYLYRSWEMMELSTVTIPCNQGATISAVKSACGQRGTGFAIPLNSRSSTVKLTTRGSVPLKTSSSAVELYRPAVRLITTR